MTARDRTAYWVQTYSTGGVEFHSPSVPPSELDYTPSTPSDAGSYRSIPPRMVLRYDDGRPDHPIPHARERYGGPSRGYDGHDPRSHYNARARGREYNGAYASPPYVEVQSRRPTDRVLLNAPEQIRVLPAMASHSHPRSRSLPRSDLSPLPQQILPLPPSGSYAPGSHGSAPQRHSRPEMHGHSSRPSHAYYRPVHHPPQVGPNSVIYSHSAPPVLMHHTTAHPRTGAPEQRRVMQDGRMELNSRTRSVSMSGQRHTYVDRSDMSSSDSEPETSYYGSRSRTKTPVSTPSSGKSVATAASSRPPVTPSSTIYGKRPFFQRLMHFAGKFSHAGPSRVIADAGDLHRRHSIGAGRH